jgi:hypothetical protein
MVMMKSHYTIPNSSLNPSPERVSYWFNLALILSCFTTASSAKGGDHKLRETMTANSSSM